MKAKKNDPRSSHALGKWLIIEGAVIVVLMIAGYLYKRFG